MEIKLTKWQLQVANEELTVPAGYGEAFYTATVTGISNNYDELTFTVVPYVVENGVTRLQESNAMTFVINDGELQK